VHPFWPKKRSGGALSQRGYVFLIAHRQMRLEAAKHANSVTSLV
jgi:hypothetical protein